MYRISRTGTQLVALVAAAGMLAGCPDVPDCGEEGGIAVQGRDGKWTCASGPDEIIDYLPPGTETWGRLACDGGQTVRRNEDNTDWECADPLALGTDAGQAAGATELAALRTRVTDLESDTEMDPTVSGLGCTDGQSWAGTVPARCA